jgi:NAD(P)-dependent dehydrogenase (short-subunit alcohol dehydrogenase family)
MKTDEQRIAVVTGAGGGIGSAVALRLARDGAAVVAVDRDPTPLEAVVRAVTDAGGRCVGVAADIADENRVDDFAGAAEREFGRCADLVVANAGHQTFAPVESLSPAGWDEVMAVNARGTFLTLRAVCGRMARAGVPGAAVTVASVQGRLGSRYYPHYSASKAAVLNLTKSLALWGAPHGVRVNAVAPGIVETALWEKADRELAAIRHVAPGVPRAERIARIPLRRAGTPQDVAGAVAFLLGDDAAYITGECLHVCGGDVML